jgi:hypothetical protein
MASKLLEERTSDMDEMSKSYVKIVYSFMAAEDKTLTIDDVKDRLYSITPEFRTDKIFQDSIFPAYNIALMIFCEEKNIAVPKTPIPKLPHRFGIVRNYIMGKRIN